MRMIPDKKKKKEAEHFFAKQSLQFRLYAGIGGAARVLAWAVPLVFGLSRGLYYRISHTPVPGYVYVSTALNMAIFFITFQFIAWGMNLFCNLEYHQYPFGKEEEYVELTPEGNLIFRYRVGKKHYMDNIRITSTEERPEWNAVAVEGWIQHFVVRGDHHLLQNEKKGARVFFDYYDPSLIRQFNKKEN